MTALLLVMTSSIFYTWSELFFNCDMENIELSKLVDGEGENEEEKTEKDVDEKIKYNSLISIKIQNDYRIHSDKAHFLLTTHIQDILTPPPEFIKELV